jgi:hypothetical protein
MVTKLGNPKAGFLANTDFGWFSRFLHRAKSPDDVNFWRPSPHGFKATPAGVSFLSRLGARAAPSSPVPQTTRSAAS